MNNHQRDKTRMASRVQLGVSAYMSRRICWYLSRYLDQYHLVVNHASTQDSRESSTWLWIRLNHNPVCTCRKNNIFTCSTPFSYLIVTIQHGSGAFCPTASGNLILGFHWAHSDLARGHPVRVLESLPCLYEELLYFKGLSCVASAYQKIWSLRIQLDELTRKELCVGTPGGVVHW